MTRTLVLAAYLISRPVPTLTPGAVCSPADPDFAAYASPSHVAICRRHVTRAVRRAVFAAYGIPQRNWRLYELDHLIPIAIGGSNSPRNLWPELLSDAGQKDRLEARLARELRAGRIDQAGALRGLAGK